MTPEEQRDFTMMEYIENSILPSGLMLYVGIGPHPQHHLINWIIKKGYQITMLEPYEPYITPAQQYFARHNPELKIEWVIGDIRKAHEIFNGRTFNVVMWSHGPEHVKKEELRTIFDNLSIISNQIYCGCPNGIYPQDAVGGNKWEIHRSHLYVKDFEELGFTARSFGVKDLQGPDYPGERIGSILAYRGTNVGR